MMTQKLVTLQKLFNAPNSPELDSFLYAAAAIALKYDMSKVSFLLLKLGDQRNYRIASMLDLLFQSNSFVLENQGAAVIQPYKVENLSS